MVLLILFWILWILWVLGYFFPLGPTGTRVHSGVACILIGILGYMVFGSPLSKQSAALSDRIGRCLL
jgi:hypothetical protein